MKTCLIEGVSGWCLESAKPNHAREEYRIGKHSAATTIAPNNAQTIEQTITWNAVPFPNASTWYSFSQSNELGHAL